MNRSIPASPDATSFAFVCNCCGSTDVSLAAAVEALPIVPVEDRAHPLKFKLHAHRKLRRDAFMAADFTCCVCGYRPERIPHPREAYTGQFTVGDLQVDHIVPRARGGQNAPANLRVMCGPCNLSKNAR